VKGSVAKQLLDVDLGPFDDSTMTHEGTPKWTLGSLRETAGPSPKVPQVREIVAEKQPIKSGMLLDHCLAIEFVADKDEYNTLRREADEQWGLIEKRRPDGQPGNQHSPYYVTDKDSMMLTFAEPEA